MGIDLSKGQSLKRSQKVMHPSARSSVTGPCENGDSLQNSLRACQIKLSRNSAGAHGLQHRSRRDKKWPDGKGTEPCSRSGGYSWQSSRRLLSRFDRLRSAKSRPHRLGKKLSGWISGSGGGRREERGREVDRVVRAWAIGRPSGNRPGSMVVFY